MNTKHTPGPWTLKADPFHFDTLSSIVGGEAKGENMRFPSHELHVEIGGFADFRRQEANARLIAASPCLLEALQLVRDYVVTLKGAGHDYQLAIDAAIAKATGEDAP